MKYFSTLLILIIFVVISSAAEAQTIALKAGLNLSNMLMKDDFGTYNTNDLLPGFILGGTIEFPIENFFSLETGLLLSSKRLKYEQIIVNDTLNVKNTGKTHHISLDIPINAKFRFDIGEAKLYGLIGPYLGFGMFGNYESELIINDNIKKEKGDIDWNNNYKRFDYGLNFGVGAELSNILFEINYSLGLANITYETHYNAKMINRALSLLVGYKL